MAAVAVVAVVAALVLLGPAPADARNCQPYNNNKLVQMCGSKYFDLRNITGQDGSNLLTAMDVQRGNEYFVQFDGSGVPKKLPKCTVDSDTNNLGMQVRLDGGGCYRLGSVDLMIFNFDNATKQFSVTATGGDKGRSMMINTQCTFGNDFASLTETGETGNTYNFNLNLPSKRCTNSPPSGGGGGGGGGSSTDGGAIVLAVFFGVLGAYFVFGTIYLAAAQGKRGVEMVPNREFWFSLPGLVQDGSLFVLAKIRGTASRGNYSQI